MALLATVASQNRIVLPKEVTRRLRASSGAEIKFSRFGVHTALVERHSGTHGRSQLPSAILQARRRLTLPLEIVQHLRVVPGDLVLFEIRDVGVAITAADVRRRR